jgi:hypothetical protein
MAITVTLPGVDIQCIVTDERVSTYGDINIPGVLFWMKPSMYDELLEHQCQTFVLLNSGVKRLTLRRDTPATKWFGLVTSDIMTVGNITARRYAVTQMASPRSLISGGYLLGFDDLADAVMFRLTYSDI